MKPLHGFYCLKPLSVFYKKTAVRVIIATAMTMCVSVGNPTVVFAKDSDQIVSKFAVQLKSSSDFRVRLQAALALGTSENIKALKPLCEGLSDLSVPVRNASALAIGKLNLGGEDCLAKHLNTEKEASTKEVIKKVLDELRTSGSISNGTRIYLVIAEPGGTASADSRRVISSIDKTSVPGGVQIAPDGEPSIKSASKLAKAQSVKGYLISPKISVEYIDGDLKLRIEIAFFSYPDNNFLGQLSKTLTSQGGGSKKDIAAENELIQMAMTSLLPKLVSSIGKL